MCALAEVSSSSAESRGERTFSRTVRSHLEQVWSGRASRAREKERKRPHRTGEELAKKHADLDHGRFDNGILNDVIDSIRKSSNDKPLPLRDRGVLADDVSRLQDYQQHQDHWR